MTDLMVYAHAWNILTMEHNLKRKYEERCMFLYAKLSALLKSHIIPAHSLLKLPEKFQFISVVVPDEEYQDTVGPLLPTWNSIKTSTHDMITVKFSAMKFIQLIDLPATYTLMSCSCGRNVDGTENNFALVLNNTTVLFRDYYFEMKPPPSSACIFQF